MMHRMQSLIRVLIFLGCSLLGSGTLKEDTLDNAITTCNNKLNTDFDFKFVEPLTKSPQTNDVFFKYSSYFRRPSNNLRRLFPWLYELPKHHFVLTTAWKRPLTETKGPDTGLGNSNNMVVKTCSGYLTNEEPTKYVITCNTGTQEGTGEEKTVEVSPITTIGQTEEGSGYDQDEEVPDDNNWDLSRCLGCIFGMLNKPLGK